MTPILTHHPLRLLRLLDHLLQMLDRVLVGHRLVWICAYRRLTQRLLCDLLLNDFLHFLDRETYNASPDLDCLSAIRIQLDVFLLRKNERTELREVVFQLELTFDWIELDKRVAAGDRDVADTD